MDIAFILYVCVGIIVYLTSIINSYYYGPGITVQTLVLGFILSIAFPFTLLCLFSIWIIDETKPLIIVRGKQ